ncbi:MAG: hypothetical protein B6D68_01240 [spirochete symbiont of Stewartia floridana]|nr:MAG: hypothetical protein B6D68_01240 [spirochete symbiont of Stewartia floridana]
MNIDNSPPQSERLAEALLLLVAFIWGSGFVATHGALASGVSPIFITALRFAIATALLYILYFRRLRNLKPLLLPGAVLGFFLATAFIFQTIGLRYTTPSKNAFLTATNIIFTPFIYFIATRCPIRRRIILSVALAIIGIAFLTLDEVSRINLGDLLTLICAVFFAFHIYFIGFYVKDKGCEVIKIVFLQFFYAACISTAAALVFERSFVLPPKGFAYVGYLAVFSTAIAFFIQNSMQRFVTQSKTALILSAEAAFGTLLSIILLKERITSLMIAGFILLFLGIVAALDFMQTDKLSP